jgi:hypothetical protein
MGNEKSKINPTIGLTSVDRLEIPFHAESQEAPPIMSGRSAQAESTVLEEEIDPNYEPTEDEIKEYATWLGMVRALSACV